MYVTICGLSNLRKTEENFQLSYYSTQQGQFCVCYVCMYVLCMYSAQKYSNLVTQISFMGFKLFWILQCQ
jgi:hypothetical protein